MRQLFTRRRVLSSVAGSVLLHGLLLMVVWRRPQASRAPLSIDVSVRTNGPPTEAQTRVAVVGSRPSGRGRAAAGSNPTRQGSPAHAHRFQDARGRANGPGRMGTAAAERSAAPENATGEPAAVDLIAPASAPDQVPIMFSGSARAAPPDPPQLSAAPSVDADRAFDLLARAQLLALSKGNGGGLAGFGSGRGGTGMGLATELSGRHVEESPVVNAPVIVEGRPVECELPESLNLRAVVRVLVTRDGSPAVPRLLRTSGHEAFDRCAVNYVLALRFTPGTNDRAQPLDVWMNVQVAPVTGRTR